MKTYLQSGHKSKIAVMGIITILVLITCVGFSSVFGAQVYSKDDEPFGMSYSDWIGKWWNWWIGVPSDEFDDQGTPKDSCLLNKTGNMTMLMETAISGKPQQICTISSTQGIMIPLWTGFYDESASQEHKNDSYEGLTNQARSQVNLGTVNSKVMINGTKVAELEETSSIKAGSLDYKIISMKNVTEIYSKGFNITIPENTHMPDQIPGTWRSGAHGWYVFLKPLPPGNYEIFYDVAVTGTGPNDHSSEITYSIKVE